MLKHNEGFVVAIDGFTKWREETKPSQNTYYMSYTPKQEIGISNPLYEHFLTTDFFTPTNLRFAEIFTSKAVAEKFISFLTDNEEILNEKNLFYPMPGQTLNLRVQKVSLHIISED